MFSTSHVLVLRFREFTSPVFVSRIGKILGQITIGVDRPWHLVMRVALDDGPFRKVAEIGCAGIGELGARFQIEHRRAAEGFRQPIHDMGCDEPIVFDQGQYAGQAIDLTLARDYMLEIDYHFE